MENEFKTVSDFIDRITRARFEGALHHKTQVVTRAISDNRMPAHWFFERSDLCAEVGAAVPERLLRQSHHRIATTTTPIVEFDVLQEPHCDASRECFA